MTQPNSTAQPLDHHLRLSKELSEARLERDILRDAIWQWYLRLEGAEENLRKLAREVGAPTLPTLAPVSSGHAPEEDIASRLVAEGEPRAANVGDGVVAGGLDDFADADEGGAVEAGDGDLHPVADVELHAPKSSLPGWPLTGLCGICNQTVGCECAS